MDYFKQKDIEIDDLLRKIDDALNEDRYVVYEVTSTCGILTHRSGYFNIKDSVIINENKDGKATLMIVPYSPSRIKTPSIYIDITDSQNYHITDCGANGGIVDPKTGGIALCRLYKLDTRQTNIDGRPACTIRFHIKEKQ